MDWVALALWSGPVRGISNAYSCSQDVHTWKRNQLFKILNKLERNEENPEVRPLVMTLGCGRIYGESVFFSISECVHRIK